jgi:RNA polymerase sigma factor (sigma-70 family)
VTSAKKREPATLDEETDDRLDPSMNLEEIRIATEQQQAVLDCVEDLPPRCRSLLQMLYLDVRSPSYQEIGETIGMPVPSIGANRARCLEKLRRILRKRGVD